MNALALIGVLMLLMALRVPVVFSLLLSSLFYLVFIKPIPFLILAHRMLGSLESFPLLALPLFILAADIMNAGRTTEEMFKFARALVGPLRGGMGHVVVVASMIFAGISGTITAEAAGLGKLELPLMEKAGYEKPFALGLISAASIIGPIIPPSVQMVLYAMIAEQSVGRLFVGGVVPGMIMGLCLMIMVYLSAWRRNFPRDEKASPRLIWSTFKTAFPALVTPAIILGGILSGVFTPTEAGVVAVVWALFISFFIYKSIKLRQLPPLLISSAVMTALILVIMGAASVFGWLVTMENIPTLIKNALMSATDKQWIILLILNLAFLIAGCFFDICAIILVFTPMILPVLQAFHIDLVHWGVVETLNVCIGFLTPPFGVGLFIMSDMTGLSVAQVTKAVSPFLIPLLVSLALITYYPFLVTWLPKMVFG
ncbi:MAG: TRAP transporter large permease [Thermodesulfobacteriota bacterium]